MLGLYPRLLRYILLLWPSLSFPHETVVPWDLYLVHHPNSSSQDPSPAPTPILPFCLSPTHLNIELQFHSNEPRATPLPKASFSSGHLGYLISSWFLQTVYHYAFLVICYMLCSSICINPLERKKKMSLAQCFAGGHKGNRYCRLMEC